ncbi:MAG: hypothetical protein LBJ87_00230, partial [bacterium]|nr:hypothetical protein [bacterium]
MLEVHALWSASGRLCLWGRTPGARSPAARDELAEELPEAGSGEPDQLTLLLPERGSLRRRRVPVLAQTAGAALDVLPALAAGPPT